MALKKSIIIILILFLAIVFIFSVLYLMNRQPINQTVVPINVTNQEQLSQQQKINQEITDKVQEKMQAIEAKSPEEIKENGYSQDEVNFILDPVKTAEKEMGIKQESSPKPYTPQEVDKILNPAKK